jgi:predicted enzyme related to lactoylglutathione lyase
MPHHKAFAQENMNPQAVKYVLMAQDMNRAVAFYRDSIGFAEDFVSPYWSELRFGDAILGLHGGGDGSRQQTGLSIQYENVERAYAEAIESGATAIQPPERREGEPIILASIADPEGNVIMLTQYVGHE